MSECYKGRMDEQASVMPLTAPRRKIPGPRGHFLLGSLRERQTDPLKLFETAARTYGPVFKLRFGPIRVLVVNDPEGVRHILHENAKNYIKGLGYDKLAPLFGNGLLTSEGEFWRRQRRLAQPAFHRQRIEGFTRTMAEVTDQTARQWSETIEKNSKEARPTEILPTEILSEMMQIAYRIVSRTLFTSQIDEDVSTVRSALDLLSTEANHRITHPIGLPSFLPTLRNRRNHAAVESMNGVIYKIIAQRRAAPERHSDLLSMLMDARDEDTGQGMTDSQLRDEIMTLFTAGHETTAMALTWTIYLLSKNPEIESKLLAELDHVLGDGSRPLSFQDLPQLSYLSWTIQESMRIYPPGWMISRQALGEDVVCGYRIRKNQVVLTPPWLMHRNEKYWPDPEKFDPTRFSPEQEARRPKLAYYPFGAGPRQCIGNTFALTEMHFVLAGLLRRFRFRLLDGHPVVPHPQITLRPKYGMPMFIEPRLRSN